MKNPIVRVLIRAMLFALVCGIVIAIVGWRSGWQTYIQFSDAFFLTGGALISIGLLNLMGTFTQRTVAGLPYSQSAVHLDAAERFKIWEADTLRGRNLLIFLGTSGLLLFGLSALAILIGRRP